MTDPREVKKGFVKVLRCVATMAKAAEVINPFFNVASALLNVVLERVDDIDLIKLMGEFEKINNNLKVISRQHQQILLDVQKAAVDKQYAEIEDNLRKQFERFEEIVKAEPKDMQRKENNFIERYDDQYMNNLYKGVMGIRKLFSLPIMEVYRMHSNGDKQVMKTLCKHLYHLFNIGYITMMAFYDFKGDDMKQRKKEWDKKIKELQGVMGEWM